MVELSGSDWVTGRFFAEGDLLKVCTNERRLGATLTPELGRIVTKWPPQAPAKKDRKPPPLILTF